MDRVYRDHVLMEVLGGRDSEEEESMLAETKEVLAQDEST